MTSRDKKLVQTSSVELWECKRLNKIKKTIQNNTKTRICELSSLKTLIMGRLQFQNGMLQKYSKPQTEGLPGNILI